MAKQVTVMPSAPAAPAAGPVREQELAGAWASMLDRTEAIADRVAHTLLSNEPAYARGGQAMRAELCASCREHVDRGVRTMAGLAEPGQEAVHVWRETGRRRARQGIPMDVVLRAYSLGSRALWEGLLTRCAEGGLHADGHMLVLAGQRLWRSMDVQNATLVESYRREHARRLRDLQHQHSLLDGLAQGRGADPAFAQEVCDGLGLSPGEPLACVAAPLDGPGEQPLADPGDRLDRAGVVSHWHVRAGTLFGVVALGVPGRGPDGAHSDDAVRRLVRLLDPCVHGPAALARAPDGPSGFATAYRLAMRAARTLPDDSRRLVTLEERLPEVLLTTSPDTVTPLLDVTLGPVLALPEPQAHVLLDTLCALLAHDGSPTHAARQLYCHRNTVLYRLHRIESLTGRRLGDPRDKLLLSLGVLATGRKF